MENANKALIIAGAILIAILLIALALYIFNSGKGTTDQAQILGSTMSSGAVSGVDTIKRGLRDSENRFWCKNRTWK